MKGVSLVWGSKGCRIVLVYMSFVVEQLNRKR